MRRASIRCDELICKCRRIRRRIGRLFNPSGSFPHSAARVLRKWRAWRDFAPLKCRRRVCSATQIFGISNFQEASWARTSCHSYVLLATPMAEGEFLIKCHSETSTPSAAAWLAKFGIKLHIFPATVRKWKFFFFLYQQSIHFPVASKACEHHTLSFF